MPKIRLPDIPVRKSMPLPSIMAERVVWQSRASQLENLRDYFTWTLAIIPIVLGGIFIHEYVFFALLIPFLGAARRWLETFRKSYQLTEDRLRVRHGIFRQSAKEVELVEVNDIALKTPVMLKLFGRGSVRVRTDNERVPTLMLIAVPQPEEVYRSVYEQVARRHQDNEDLTADPLTT